MADSEIKVTKLSSKADNEYCADLCWVKDGEYKDSKLIGEDK